MSEGGSISLYEEIHEMPGKWTSFLDFDIGEFGQEAISWQSPSTGPLELARRLDDELGRVASFAAGKGERGGVKADEGE